MALTYRRDGSICSGVFKRFIRYKLELNSIRKKGTNLFIKRQQDIEGIMNSLSLLRYYIKFSSNKLGLHNINKMCEPLFADFFNIMYGLNLKTIKDNSPIIDLADNSNKYSIQMTTDGSKRTFMDTIEKFEKEELYKKYDKLLYFIVGEGYFTPKNENNHEFKKGNNNSYFADVTIGKHKYQIIIQDIYELLHFIDSEELSQIHDYIKKNINEFINNHLKFVDDLSDVTLS